MERIEGSKRCPLCRRPVQELFPLTAQDIQREKDSDVLVCERCREEFRGAARLEVKYKTPIALRDFALTTMVGVVGIVLLTDFLYTYRSASIGPEAALYFVTVLFIFSAISQVWTGLQHRYGFTHNLRWSLHSRRVVIPLGFIGSCLVVLVLSAFVSLVTKF